MSSDYQWAVRRSSFRIRTNAPPDFPESTYEKVAAESTSAALWWKSSDQGFVWLCPVPGMYCLIWRQAKSWFLSGMGGNLEYRWLQMKLSAAWRERYKNIRMYNQRGRSCLVSRTKLANFQKMSSWWGSYNSSLGRRLCSWGQLLWQIAEPTLKDFLNQSNHFSGYSKVEHNSNVSGMTLWSALQQILTCESLTVTPYFRRETKAVWRLALKKVIDSMQTCSGLATFADRQRQQLKPLTSKPWLLPTFKMTSKMWMKRSSRKQL